VEAVMIKKYLVLHENEEWKEVQAESPRDAVWKYWEVNDCLPTKIEIVKDAVTSQLYEFSVCLAQVLS